MLFIPPGTETHTVAVRAGQVQPAEAAGILFSYFMLVVTVDMVASGLL